MSGMIKYEWKKIWKSRLAQLSIIGCGLFLVFCVWSSIMQISVTNENGENFSGMSAVEVMKDTQKNIELTQKNVDEIVRQYLKYTSDPNTNSESETHQYLSEEVYRTFYLPNRDLLSLITNVYREPGSGSSMKEVLEENVGKDFREAQIKRDNTYIDLKKEQGRLTSSEANYWKEKTGNLQEYQYGYHKGWSMILDTLTWPVLIMMIICIGIAPIFAGEYQSKCDSLILCMKYGKSKLIFAKIVSGWLYATCVYWGITLIYSSVYMIFLGTQGADLPIQLKYPAMSVGYNLTMGEAVVIALLLGYFFTLGIMGITLFMSALLKNTYAVIIVAFLLIIIPTFLSPDTGGYTWSHVLSLLPPKIADFSFQSYTAYSIGNIVLSWPVMAILINAIVAVICSVLGYIVFRKHQVNK
ncbi:MAG: ABC transporter permease [Mediterraneibacter gnavus]